MKLQYNYMLAVLLVATLLGAYSCTQAFNPESYTKGCATGAGAVIVSMNGEPSWDKINDFCGEAAKKQLDLRNPGK